MSYSEEKIPSFKEELAMKLSRDSGVDLETCLEVIEGGFSRIELSDLEQKVLQWWKKKGNWVFHPSGWNRMTNEFQAKRREVIDAVEFLVMIERIKPEVSCKTDSS
jgi:hypothetical protein